MKCIKWIVLTALSFSAISSTAATIPTATGGIINDTYIGAGYAGDVNGGYPYDIESMTVSRVDSMLTVVIQSDFVGNNGNSIGFGDLFMAVNTEKNDANSPWKPFRNDPTGARDRFASEDMTDVGKMEDSLRERVLANPRRYSRWMVRKAQRDSNDVTYSNTTNTSWNYAYTLNNSERNNNNGQGQLITNFNDLVHSNTGSHRKHQAVAVEQSLTTGWGDTNWSTDIAAKTLTFSFDVSNTHLENASQIAFRWAMTCANDIIEGLVSFKSKDPTTPVPEPHTLLLMLLGMAGIAYRRKANS